MINAQLNLIIPVFVQSKNCYQLLSLSDTSYIPPRATIKPYDDLYAIAEMLIRRHVKNPSIFNAKLTDVISTDILDVFFICFINYDILLLNSFLIDTNPNYELIPQNAKKTLSLLARV